jgi:hypothetical protein
MQDTLLDFLGFAGCIHSILSDVWTSLFFFWDRIAWGSDLQSTYTCDWIARNGWLVIRMKWETIEPLCVRTWYSKTSIIAELILIV